MEMDIRSNRKLTERQSEAVNFWLKDKKRSKARALRKAGYSEAVARQPHKVFDSPAVKRMLWEYNLGNRVAKNEEKAAQEDFRVWQRQEEEKNKAVTEAIKSIPEHQLIWLRKELDKLPDLHPDPEDMPGSNQTKSR